MIKRLAKLLLTISIVGLNPQALGAQDDGDYKDSYSDDDSRCPFLLRKFIKVSDLNSKLPDSVKLEFIRVKEQLEAEGLQDVYPFDENYFSNNATARAFITDLSTHFSEQLNEEARAEGKPIDHTPEDYGLMLTHDFQMSHWHLLYLNSDRPDIRAISGLQIVEQIRYYDRLSELTKGLPEPFRFADKNPDWFKMVNDVFPKVGTAFMNPYTNVTKNLGPAYLTVLSDTNAALANIIARLGTRDLEIAEVKLIEAVHTAILPFEQFGEALLPAGVAKQAFQENIELFNAQIEKLNDEQSPISMRLYQRLAITRDPNNEVLMLRMLQDSEILQNLKELFPIRDPKTEHRDPTRHAEFIDELFVNGESMSVPELMVGLNYLVSNRYYKAAVGLYTANNSEIMARLEMRAMDRLRLYAIERYEYYATHKLDPDTNGEPSAREIEDLGLLIRDELEDFHTYLAHVRSLVDPKLGSPQLIEDLEAWKKVLADIPEE